MDKQIKFMRKLIADLVADARLHKTSMASIVGNGNFVAEQIMNDVYNQALEDIFNLAKQNAYDDGVGYSIGLHKLDELIAGLNK